MSWQLKEKLQQMLAEEQGAMVYAPGSREGFALVYPNTHNVGMSNLGFHIIYQQINLRADTACERLFLPDKKTEQEYVRTNTPLMTLENQRPLYEFPLIGIDVTYEMDYFNVLKVLALGKVTLKAADRTENEPIVIMGGPCATFNPEPLAPFIDVCVIGEGEEVIHDLLDTYYQGRAQGLARREILKRLANVEGLYVPQFYHPVYNEDGIIKRIEAEKGVPVAVKRRWVKDLDRYEAQTVVVTSDTEFKDMFLIEVARGCGRHCRFCMAGYCYREPRVRSLEKLKTAVLKAKAVRNKVGLMGAAISDYPEIEALCAFILSEQMDMSVASLRADSLTAPLVEALAASGHKTITLAPEAGSMRMRRIINKGITDEHLYESVTMAVKAGIPHVRLYIMVGLPFEEEDDIDAIITMALNIKQHMEQLGSKGKLTLSINPFITKPFTPFQWLPMTPSAIVEARLKKIHGALKSKKNIEVLIESPKEAYIQGVLARGDRRLADVLLTAFEKGGPKSWKQAMKAHQLDEHFYLSRVRSTDEILPWHVLAMGFDPLYLVEELDKAVQEKFTAPCTAGCVRCGVCR